MMRDVLVVIDMQNDFIDGSLGTGEAQEIVSYVGDRIREYLDAGRRVFFTRDTHPDNYLDTFEGKKLPVVHCVENTEGWRISDRLPWDEGLCRVVDKGTFGFLGWRELLQDVGSIEVCGLCTDICVISNALILRAIYPDREITVDSRACAGVTPRLHEAALEVMRSNQIEIL